MSDKIGPYEIVERIDPDGYTLVYRAVEDMGHGIQRQAALKVLRGVKTDDEEAMSNLLREAGLLLEVSNSPNIVTVYGFGVDEQQGPWLAMELAGGSLKHYVSDEPTDSSQVRVLVRDVLQALAVVHDKGILHRDLKPNNILSTVYGQWKVADFGLARQQASEDTMAMATVKYAAPEMLDSSLSAETPSMDLYSLGIVAYEFALGQTLFRQQFPSVYDPDAAESRTDDRPKWMYWHTSIQMTVPSVSELIPDFPKDLSDLIASLMAKQVPERVPSATKGLVLLGEVRARIELGEDEQEEQEASGGNGVRTLLLALVAVLVFVGLAAYVYLSIDSTPIVTLVKDSGRYEGSTSSIAVTGKIANVPKGGGVTIRLRDGTPFPVIIDDEGRFSSNVRVPKLGEVAAQLLVTRAGGESVTSRILKLIRYAPEKVRVVISTSPPAQNADVTVTPVSSADPLRTKTDSNGVARVDVPYGDFALEVRHVCFKRISVGGDSGFDDVKDITAWLEPISKIRAQQMRQAILDDLPEVVAKANADDADAKERIAQMREEIRCLGTDGADPQEEEMWKALEGALDDAANGNLAAADAALETRDKIADRRTEMRAGGNDPGQSAADQLVSDTKALEAALARGDLAAAKKIADRILANTPDDGSPASRAIREHMSKVKDGIERAENGDPSGLADARSAAKNATNTAVINASLGGTAEQQMIDDTKALEDALARGDLAAAKVIADRILANTPDDDNPVNRAIREQMAKVKEGIGRAENGDASGLADARSAAKSASTTAILNGSGGDLAATPWAGGQGPGFDAIDQATLLRLPSNLLKAFIEVNVPRGAISVDVIPRLSKLRIRGVMFSDEEVEILTRRLEPAMLRLEMEVRADAWALCRRISTTLESDGIMGARVHAYVTNAEKLLYVVYPETASKEYIAQTMVSYVIDPDIGVSVPMGSE